MAQLAANHAILDPNFVNHPLLDQEMRMQIAPHLLPLNHPMKVTLDSIFSQSRVLENEDSLRNAGFIPICDSMPRSYVIVARHSLIPGYVFKLYLDSETRCRKDVPHWIWLVRRCVGAMGIRKIIRQNQIRFFTVPDKWLYLVPAFPAANAVNPQPIILMATDMQLESSEVTREKWKTAITREHLDELYMILKEGYGGHGVVSLEANVPFTKQGTFAFTDTEDPRAKPKLKHIRKFLSLEMQKYWDSLIHP